MERFWVSVPRVKQRYRRDEHLLQAAELLATIGSLSGKASYPSQDFSDSWFLMALNMDRNVLWGAGVDASFADPKSWDTSDRFEYVESKSDQAIRQSLQSVARTRPIPLSCLTPLITLAAHRWNCSFPPDRRSPVTRVSRSTTQGTRSLNCPLNRWR